MIDVKVLLRPLFNRLHEIKYKRISVLESDITGNARSIVYRIESDLYSVDRAVLVADLKNIIKLIAEIDMGADVDYTIYAEDRNEPIPPMSSGDINIEIAEEISLYKNEVERFLDKLVENAVKQGNASKETGAIFQLPEKFNAQDITKAGFKPLLTEREATYFLYILRAAKFSPKYTNDSLSDLAPILLGRGKQSVRERLGKLQIEINEEGSKGSIQSLKEKISLLLGELDNLLLQK